MYESEIFNKGPNTGRYEKYVINIELLRPEVTLHIARQGAKNYPRDTVSSIRCHVKSDFRLKLFNILDSASGHHANKRQFHTHQPSQRMEIGLFSPSFQQLHDEIMHKVAIVEAIILTGRKFNDFRKIAR